MEVGGRLNLKGQLLEMKFGFEEELLTKHFRLSASSCACEAYPTIGMVVSQYYGNLYFVGRVCMDKTASVGLNRLGDIIFESLKFKPRSHWQPQSKIKVALDFLIDSPFSLFHLM
jgi:hypothetical protein